MRTSLSTAVVLFLVVLGGGLLLPKNAEAYFERLEAGARGTAMGGAYAAMANDASCTYWNPAALVTVPQSEFLFMFAKPYVVSNLYSSFASFVWARDAASLGISWHHTGVSDVVSEDLITIGVARDLLGPGRNYALAVGGNLKLAAVGYAATPQADYGRQTKVTGDLSVLANVTRSFALGYVMRNLVEPSFDFVGGGGDTPLRRTHDLGTAYFWHRSSTCALAATRDARGEWMLRAGAEVWFYDVFSLRTGFSSGEFSGGAGLRASRYLVDLAFVTHAELGISYEVSVRVPFGERRW